VGEAELKAFLEDKGVSPELATQLTTRLWEMVGGAPTMAPAPASGTSSPSPALHFDDADSRYEDRGLLGRGGMGEVRLVFDRRLNRELAMKVLRAEVSADAELMDRFLDEAQVTAQLQHPSIIPLHDFGRLPDGRLFFTMKEVKGRTLTQVIHEVHVASTEARDDWELTSEGGWRASASGWTLRRLLDAFQRVCDAVAYAHARGVLHRDLKPHNIMVGDFGEVLVLDWGLTRVGRATRRHDALVLNRRATTTSGLISGTPGYMAPEQASGDVDRIEPAGDVYALGATLYCILSGHTPPVKDGYLPLNPPPVLPERVGEQGPVIPVELRELCGRAMAWAPADRPDTASALARSVAEWLEGAQRRARAMELLSEARALEPALSQRRQDAGRLGAQADESLQQIPPFAPLEQKLPSWQMQDDARRLASEATSLQTRRTQLLRAALTHASDFDIAHQMLADIFHEQHAAAEARRDSEEAATIEPLLREHDRGKWATYLHGDGVLDLVTTPPGASLRLFRLEEERRVTVATFVRELGPSPLFGMRLPMGHYLVTIALEGHHDVRYPVFIDRQHHWDGIRTGDSQPHPIQLPSLGELGNEDCYVPAGWFWSGGDAQANNSLPAQRLWLDGFIMRRFPVTIEEFVTFLNDLTDRGRLEEARTYAPEPPAWEQRSAARHEHGVVLGDDGRFHFPGPPEQLRWPVVLVNWPASAAYAAWLAEREGRPWRLVAEMEHEKAARGVNASPFPWGTYLDPTFCKMRHSTAGEGRNVRATVDAFPTDESVYGICGLAGNVHSWCIDPYQPRGPKLIHDVPQISDGSDVRGPGAGGVHRIVRGGSWRDPEANLRGAFRDSPPATYRDTTIGLRVARPYP